MLVLLPPENVATHPPQPTTHTTRGSAGRAPSLAGAGGPHASGFDGDDSDDTTSRCKGGRRLQSSRVFLIAETPLQSSGLPGALGRSVSAVPGRRGGFPLGGRWSGLAALGVADGVPSRARQRLQRPGRDALLRPYSPAPYSPARQAAPRPWPLALPLQGCAAALGRWLLWRCCSLQGSGRCCRRCCPCRAPALFRRCVLRGSAGLLFRRHRSGGPGSCPRSPRSGGIVRRRSGALFLRRCYDIGPAAEGVLPCPA